MLLASALLILPASMSAQKKKAAAKKARAPKSDAPKIENVAASTTLGDIDVLAELKAKLV